MAALPAGEPGVPRSGARRDPPPPAFRRGLRARRLGQVACAAGLLGGVLALGLHVSHGQWRPGAHALPDTARLMAAAIVLFAVAGFGPVRLWLPAPLRTHEALWIVPAGACLLGLAFTVLGFARVPYHVSLAVLVSGSFVVDGVALHRAGRPRWRLAPLAWPLLVAATIACVALVPMVFEQHYVAVTGTGSDAHVAAGTANLLKHTGPQGIAPGQPIDRMPPLWTSKYPIYYALAAVSSVSGLETWQALPVLAALLLALAAIGLFLVARDLLGAPPAVAVLAMTLAGLDRMALHTGLNPYFNQTWGYFAMPFTLALGWWVVQPGLPRRGVAAVLLAAFAIVLVFAYPLAAPIPAVPLAVFLWSERRRRVAAGEPVLRPRDLYRGRRSLIWLIPGALLMTVPVLGVLAKAIGAASVLAPGHSLRVWAGDLLAFIPFNFFLSLPDSALGNLGVLVLFWLAWRELRTQPKPIAIGLGGLLAIGVLLAAYLRHRQYGWYFHFKLMAFCGPLILLVGAIGATRLRRAGPVLLALFALAGAVSVKDEVAATGFQLSTAEIQLRDWAAALPRGASVRLDMDPPVQLWAAYMLSSRPLCSLAPLLGTDYPHVAISRRADYIVASPPAARPADAAGPRLRVSDQFALFRENPAVPGPDLCSLRRRSRLFDGGDYSPR